jgi:hypothetical protein
MGGQACVFYGAAEFSRDLDLLILADGANIERLRACLRDLEAEPIAVPELRVEYLEDGHAVHFRCGRPDVDGLRLDLMSRYRGGPPFEELWSRRTVIEADGDPVDILAIEDLVQAKKTQRDKDWPMITRLVDQSYLTRGETPSRALVEFWLRELRTPAFLVELAGNDAEAARNMAALRPAVAAALDGDPDNVAQSLTVEEGDERRRDREYWQPLRLELERLRHERRTQKL